MSKKYFSSRLASISLVMTVAAAAFSPGAYAKISPKAIKGITSFFKNGKEFYSVTLGQAALESGLIHDLRFYGNLEDLPLLEILFPSPAGHLAVETTAKNNFAKYVKDAKPGAYLLNFSKDTRAYLEGKQSLLEEKKAQETKQQDILQHLQILENEIEEGQSKITAKNIEVEKCKNEMRALKEQRMTQKEEVISEKKDTLQRQYDVLKDKLEKLMTESQKLKEDLGLGEKKKNKQAWARQQKETVQSIVIKEEEHEKKFAALKTTAFQKIRESLDLKEGDTLKEGTPIDATLKGILNSIEGSLRKEKTAFYPLHTTEQIITAFICEKLDTQQDIFDLLENLDGDIVDKSKPLPKQTDYLQQEDLEIIAKKETAYDYDDIFALENASLFSLITPYKPGTTLVSNGNTYPYNRSTDTITKNKNPFADCVEKAALHLMNLLLFDGEQKTFDLSHLKTRITPDNPYFKNFGDYYAIQTPNLANAGDIEMRSKWNRVMGDANEPGDPLQIKYRQGTYEIASGFINFIKIYQKIFALNIEDVPQKGLIAKKEWLEKSLKTLFTTLNDQKIYNLNCSDLREVGSELLGTVPITVSDNFGTELFSFNFNVKERHTHISDLKIIKTVNQYDFSDFLQSHSNNIKDGTTDESLWLLEKSLSGKAQHPLYVLFNTPLVDNDSRIKVLSTINQKFAEWSDEFSPEKLTTLKKMLGNILNNMSWNDQYVIQSITPIIKSLKKKPGLEEILGNFVRGWDASSTTFDESQKILTAFPNLEYVIFPREEKKITFSAHFKNLKELNLRSSAIEKIEGLEYLTNLEVFDLGFSKQLQGSFSVKNLRNLKVLTLDAVNISNKTLILENLINLKNLSLQEINIKNLLLKDLPGLEDLQCAFHPSLEQIVFEGDFLNLKKLELGNSKIQSLEGINNVTNLEELDLTSTKNLRGSLKLNNFGKLKKLDLYGSGIEEIVGLNTLLNAEELSLGEMPQLPDTLALNDLHNLKALRFEGSNFKKIALENLPKLEMLYGINSSKLEEISLKNLPNLKNYNFRFVTQVKKISLENLNISNLYDLQSLSIQKIEEIDIKNCNNIKKIELYSNANINKINLENLSSLEEVELSNTNNLKTAFLKNLNNLKTLNMSGSGIKKMDIVNLPNLETLLISQETKDLTVANLPSLKTLDFWKSEAEVLTFKDLIGVETLDLSSLKNLKKVKFEGDFSSLKTLTFAYSTQVKNIEGLELLGTLKRLDLSSTTNLQPIVLGEKNEELKLIIRGSNLKKANIKGIDHLDENNVTW